MAKDHCTECGAQVDEDSLIYNEYAGVDVCEECDDALCAQEAIEIGAGAQFPPREREDEA